MDGILAWGLDVVRLVQRGVAPWLTPIVKAITLMGTEWFFLAALPLVYWCVDRRRGSRLGLVLLASAFCNAWLKLLFAQPRPFQLDPSVGLASESSYGLPSGHAQASATFWGAAAPLFRRPWGIVLAIALPLLIGWTRLYLGVHFPTDLLAGWALGAGFVAAEAFLGDRIEAALGKLRPQLRLAVAAVVALGMNALYMQDTSTSGAFFGFAAGLVYAPKAAPFRADGGAVKRILRYAFGMATVAIVYLAPKALMSEAAAHLPLARFLRYGAVAAWASLGAPWLFLKIGLAGREEAPVPDQSANA
jgi:membrane-associated phospholipid phosphatase